MPESPGRELLGLKVAVLGSTSGIGRAVALELASAGADVIVHGHRSTEKADEVATLIRRLGVRSTVLMADLADRAAGDSLVESAWNTWGGLDAWLQIAGADTLTGDAAKDPFDAKLDRLWAIDVVATIRLCRQVGRRMVEQGHGSIVTTGWDQAETGMEGDSGELFAATKGAIMTFTRSPVAEPCPPRSRQQHRPRLDQDRLGRHRVFSLARPSPPRDPPRPLGNPPRHRQCRPLPRRPGSSFLTGQTLRVNGGVHSLKPRTDDPERAASQQAVRTRIVKEPARIRFN